MKSRANITYAIEECEDWRDDFVDKVQDEMCFHNWTYAVKYLKLAERYDNARCKLEEMLEEK